MGSAMIAVESNGAVRTASNMRTVAPPMSQPRISEITKVGSATATTAAANSQSPISGSGWKIGPMRMNPKKISGAQRAKPERLASRRSEFASLMVVSFTLWRNGTPRLP